MLFAQVDATAKAELEQALKAADKVYWYRRLKVIQLSSRGYRVPQIAALLDVCQATVRAYLTGYNRGGLAALRPDYQNSGRQPTLSWSKAHWEELLHRSPGQFDRLATGARNWTQKLLLQYLALYEGVKFSQSALSQLLQRLGFRWNRGRLKVTSPDPDYQVKRQRVAGLKKKPWRAS